MILASEEAAKKITDKPVFITGIGQASAGSVASQQAYLPRLIAREIAVQKAYKMAGRGQQARLRDVAAASFKQYLQYRPEAHLILGAHADHRGTNAYNMALTERRNASALRAFLWNRVFPPRTLKRSFRQRTESHR